MSYCLGIDVGTTSTAAAIVRGGAVHVVGLGAVADGVPSMLFVDRDRDLIFGEAAARRALMEPEAAAAHFKRRLGDPTPLIVRGAPYSAESLIAKLLAWVVTQVTDREGEPPAAIVASRPANWGPYKQELFDQALRLAGLAGAATVTEPHAAALHYASQQRVPDGAVIAVYDLGGGTFDAAVLAKTADSFVLLGESTGIEHLGGVDFDDAIMAKVSRTVGPAWPHDQDDPEVLRPMYSLRRYCVEAKELLSWERQASVPVLLPGVETTVQLSRDELWDMIHPRLEESVMALREALASAQIAASDLHTVLLVGGSSRIPMIADLLREEIGAPVTADVDPVYAVARGAAIAAAQLAPRAAASSPPASPRPAPQASLP
ncbi:MAG: Hsp70 family protein, partial [Acidimicrobiales bacterium]